ncbi:hypothetical protein F4808DRAFT_237080 [Astrocystis sublimbata]|nr:hypothetical protein F4808DRAFT_237080 [Astrocystis sublimbata]
MANTTVEDSESQGSLVAFEGPQDIVSTQLRLLPTSPKILILPPYQYFVKDDDVDSSFDACSQILRTHEACDARTEMARTFLQQSTPNNRRLVFMNGGTATAQLDCITAISRHETNGDYIKAETIFSELIQDGVAGLRQRSEASRISRGSLQQDATEDADEQDDGVPDDPILRAMRAADALDLETAFLEETEDLDQTIEARHRSTSEPNLPSSAGIQPEAMPFLLFGPKDDPPNPLLSGSAGQGRFQDVENWQAMTATEDQLLSPTDLPLSPDSSNGVHTYEFSRPTSAVGPPRTPAVSIPGTPAVVGEARVVNVRSFIQQAHKRNGSVDRLYVAAIRNQDVARCISPKSPPADPENNQNEQENAQEKERSSSEKLMLRSTFYSESPRPAFSRAGRSGIVRKYLPSPLNLATKEPKQAPLAEAQAQDSGRNNASQVAITEPVANMRNLETNVGSSELRTDEPFQAVLPIAEDLVVHFKGEDVEVKLEAMIQALKQGSYPTSLPPLVSEPSESTDQPGTPTTRDSTQERASQDIQQSVLIFNSDEYDPYSVHGDYLGPHTPPPYVSKHDIGSRPQAERSASIPSTVSRAQSHVSSTSSGKTFHDFDLKECKTAVCIQNSLRSILNVYFPSENVGYHQFKFPLLPELNSLWRPVFREASSGESKAARKIDMILAISAQQGVDKGLLCSITSSLEKLGRESDGTSRSGRLDLRYLIANTMQAFTSQPLANQTQDNPFSNPVLLATLIIPHLETYIAANSGTRFLILDYPPEYLPTVTALASLIGTDIFKVAGIVKADANNRRSGSSYRTPTLHRVVHSTSSASSSKSSLYSSRSSKPAYESAEKMSPATPSPSLSKANFVITSAATESEIATLITSIWRTLIEISPSYIPEGAHTHYDDAFSSSSPLNIKEQYPPLLRAAVMLGFARMPEDELRDIPHNYVSSGTHVDLPAPTHRRGSSTKSSKSSTTETIRSNSSSRGAPRSPRSPRTPRSPRAAHYQPSKLRHGVNRDSGASDRTETGDGASFYDLEDEGEQGQFDAEERKYMPLWRQDGEPPRRANRSKALKWLGLAN